MTLFSKQDTHYVSEADHHLEKCREQLPLSESQQTEMAKHAKIDRQRDQRNKETPENIIDSF